jgi:S1-C subfamily serine protease
VGSGEDLARLLAERLRPGQTVPFTLLRGGHRLEVEVHLGTRKN